MDVFMFLMLNCLTSITDDGLEDTTKTPFLFKGHNSPKKKKNKKTLNYKKNKMVITDKNQCTVKCWWYAQLDMILIIPVSLDEITPVAFESSQDKFCDSRTDRETDWRVDDRAV